ncbi:hypothetical protein THMIRHAM_00090 [Thiomicrorhabdus immobilis]|uniref:Outer membrane protein beta-barrel domain-containing protein n=2 Tax=Thiomicrorhabdus immobilis TaxID=2791037 RepID=A0ABM7MA65_9GAMM|nr:hypothetical protein THMIRHAM_00090 [Thiomicrorhabdus immobilis]
MLVASQSVIAMDNVGVAVNYGAFSGATLELSYPITQSLQVRGALSGGMGVSEKSSDTEILYKVKADGGIHRLALDYHPFANGFFLSAGYAINNFELKANGSESGSVTVGNDTFSGDVTVNANFAWDNAPTLSLGWGHSPTKGFGFMFEAGAFFTGSPNLGISGTCTESVPGSCSGFNDALKDEEAKLKDDVADYDFLPMLQAGVTYRF